MRQRIIDGSLSAGTRLPCEEELAVAFGVSRPTVRIALRRLRELGLITSERGRTGGHRVSDPSQTRLTDQVDGFITLALGGHQLTYDDLLAVRYELDVLAATSAARRAAEHAPVELLPLMNALAESRPDDLTVQTALDLDLAVHRAIADASHNELLSGFISATVFAFRRSDFASSLIEAEPILRHLDGVLAAILAGDPDAARQAMRRHHRAAGDRPASS